MFASFKMISLYTSSIKFKNLYPFLPSMRIPENVNYFLVKKALGRTDVFLDYMSVLEGVRDTCLFMILGDTERQALNRHHKTNIPCAAEQMYLLLQYAANSREEHVFIAGWSEMHFFTKQKASGAVHDLLKKYSGNPLQTKEGERDLGYLLGYPKCCVDARYVAGDSPVNREFRATPFTPCNPSCSSAWEIHYTRIAQDYEIDIKTPFIIR